MFTNLSSLQVKECYLFVKVGQLVNYELDYFRKGGGVLSVDGKLKTKSLINENAKDKYADFL